MFVKNRMGLLEGVETLVGQERRLSQITNNLANVDTAGYKRENVTFWEMLYATNGEDLRVGKASKIITDHGSGSVQQTDNPLDMAIDGPGFFRVQTPQGIRYSRAGNFTLNGAGQLVTPSGYFVLGQGGPIVLEGDQVTVSNDGRILVDNVEVDQLAIVDFADYEDLEKEGASMFRLKEGAGPEQVVENARMSQGHLEMANVQTTVEMTEMIDLHRAYQTQQKIVQTIDETDGIAISRVGKLTG